MLNQVVMPCSKPAFCSGGRVLTGTSVLPTVNCPPTIFAPSARLGSALPLSMSFE